MKIYTLEDYKKWDKYDKIGIIKGSTRHQLSTKFDKKVLKKFSTERIIDVRYYFALLAEDAELLEAMLYSKANRKQMRVIEAVIENKALPKEALVRYVKSKEWLNIEKPQEALNAVSWRFKMDDKEYKEIINFFIDDLLKSKQLPFEEIRSIAFFINSVKKAKEIINDMNDAEATQFLKILFEKGTYDGTGFDLKQLKSLFYYTIRSKNLSPTIIATSKASFFTELIDDKILLSLLKPFSAFTSMVNYRLSTRESLIERAIIQLLSKNKNVSKNAKRSTIDAALNYLEEKLSYLGFSSGLILTLKSLCMNFPFTKKQAQKLKELWDTFGEEHDVTSFQFMDLNRAISFVNTKVNPENINTKNFNDFGVSELLALHQSDISDETFIKIINETRYDVDEVYVYIVTSQIPMVPRQIVKDELEDFFIRRQNDITFNRLENIKDDYTINAFLAYITTNMNVASAFIPEIMGSKLTYFNDEKTTNKFILNYLDKTGSIAGFAKTSSYAFEDFDANTLRKIWNSRDLPKGPLPESFRDLDIASKIKLEILRINDPKVDDIKEAYFAESNDTRFLTNDMKEFLLGE